MSSLQMASGTECPSELWADVERAYAHGLASGAALPLLNTVVVLREPAVPPPGWPCVVRVSAALAQKPVLATGNAKERPAVVRNPFLPYDKDLYVRHLPPRHVLLLNKYNAVPHHLLVVTAEFEPQSQPLSASDLEAVFGVLRAMPGQGGLAFFNCGRESGHSQPHKHVQIVPLPLSLSEPGQLPMEAHVLLAARGAGPGAAFVPATLPFRAHCALIAPDASAAATLAALLAASGAGGEGGSYNVLFTSSWAAVVPRTSERCCAEASPTGCAGVALNALGFAGTVLVRSQTELAHIQRVGVAQMLQQTGVPLVANCQ